MGGFYLGSGDLSSVLNAWVASTSLTETSLQSECTQHYGRHSVRFSTTSQDGRTTGLVFCGRSKWGPERLVTLYPKICNYVAQLRGPGS